MKSFKHHYFYYPFFMLLTVFFLFFSDTTVSAAVKTSDLETVPWSMVTESSIINEKGWLQSMCATDQYIVCLVNASKKGTDPDTLIAFYRNTTDTDGNPVEQYSYAFSVTETDYEHGNGMTYNPRRLQLPVFLPTILLMQEPSLSLMPTLCISNGKCRSETEVSISLASTMFRKKISMF